MFTKVLLILLLPSAVTAATTLCPFDLVQFQPVLTQCRLQCPSTSRPVANGNFANVSIPNHFYVDNSTMVLSMDYHRGSRCELRHNEEWSTAEDATFQYKALMRVVPKNAGSFTIMQIHSKSYTGTDGKRYRKGPPLMLGRGDRGDVKDHLWAYLRVSLEPKMVVPFDLGPCPQDFFELDVLVDDGFIYISLDGHVKVREGVRHLDPLPRNYFKTGTYVHGSGTPRVEYKSLEMGPTKKQSVALPLTDAPSTGKPTATLTAIPTAMPTASPTAEPTAEPTVTPTETPTTMPTAAPIATPTVAPTATPMDESTDSTDTPRTESSVTLVSVEPDPRPGVTKLILVDAEKNQPLFELTDGHVIDKSKLPPFSIQAIVDSKQVRSVVFVVDGRTVKKEKHEPYAIAGDKSRGNYNPWSVDLGKHVITATPYERQRRERRNGGWHKIKGKSLTFTINVVSTGNMPPGQDLPRVLHLILVDTRTGDDLFPLTDGSSVDMSVLPEFTVRAVTNPEKVGSVVFLVNDNPVKTENFEPYAIAGDVGRGEMYHPWSIAPGQYNITALPFAERAGLGMEGKSASVVITVV